MTTEFAYDDDLPAREKILRAVLDLIPVHGADRVTHRLVSAQANVSPGTVTYHFSSIDDLMEEAFHLYMADFRTGLLAALEARPLQSHNDIVEFLMTMVATDPDDADMARIEYAMLGFAQRLPAFHDEVADWSRLLEQAISDALEGLGHPSSRKTATRLLRHCRGTEFDVMARRNATDIAELRADLMALIGA